MRKGTLAPLVDTLHDLSQDLSPSVPIQVTLGMNDLTLLHACTAAHDMRQSGCAERHDGREGAPTRLTTITAIQMATPSTHACSARRAGAAAPRTVDTWPCSPAQARQTRCAHLCSMPALAHHEVHQHPRSQCHTVCSLQVKTITST